MDNHDLKMWALSNVDNPAVLAAIDRLITENAIPQPAPEASDLRAAAEYRKAMMVVLDQFDYWNSGEIEAEIALQNAADIVGRAFANVAKAAALKAGE